MEDGTTEQLQVDFIPEHDIDIAPAEAGTSTEDKPELDTSREIQVPNAEVKERVPVTLRNRLIGAGLVLGLLGTATAVTVEGALHPAIVNPAADCVPLKSGAPKTLTLGNITLRYAFNGMASPNGDLSNPKKINSHGELVENHQGSYVAITHGLTGPANIENSSLQVIDGNKSFSVSTGCIDYGISANNSPTQYVEIPKS